MQVAKSLTQEIKKIAEESLKKLQEKRATLLDSLKKTSRKISDQKLNELLSVSQVVLKQETICLDPTKDQLSHCFRNISFKQWKLFDQEKFKSLAAEQVKQLLIKIMGCI